MVFSDYKPLKNFFEGGMNITKFDRWSLELQEFDISLEFIQGKLNTVTDIISHLKNGGLYEEHPKEIRRLIQQPTWTRESRKYWTLQQNH